MPANRGTGGIPTGMASVQAEGARTILERERILQNKSVTAIAKTVGISSARLQALESGSSTFLTSAESAALKKRFSEEPSVLLLPNTEANRARQRRLI